MEKDNGQQCNRGVMNITAEGTKALMGANWSWTW